MIENLKQNTASLPGQGNGMPSGRYQPRQSGDEFVTIFFRVLKGAAIYAPTNPTFLDLIEELRWIVNTVVTESERLEIKVIRDACFCNGRIVRSRADAFASYKGFIQWMRARQLGLFSFSGQVTSEDLSAFVASVNELKEGDEENAPVLTRRLHEQGIPTIEAQKLESVEHALEMSTPETLQRKAKQVYFSGISVVRGLLEGANKHSLDLRTAKRLIFNAVDLIIKDESALLGLTTIKSYDDYTFNHSMNVAIYAIALGNRLQLSMKNLSYLGIAGLFHDLGKTVVAKDILDKPGALSPEEWAVIREHPLQGARMIMRLKGWGQLSSRLIAACFEHHLKYDLTGYPPVSREQIPTLFSRIITIADCYDALSTPRVYRKAPYPSEKILALMIKESGTQFDPVLVKLLVNMMGVYPLGALVLLDTGEIGIVNRIHRDPELITRPQVCLLGYGAGTYHKDIMVDLTETDRVTGNYFRSIVRTLNPKDYHINLEELAV